MKYKRNCPNCNCIIEYKTKYNCRNAERDKRVCKKCMHVGKSQKEIYGDRYDAIIEKRSKSLKKVNHWWHDKIAESRHKNGTYILTDSHKKKISEKSIFSQSGKDHVRIKKILEEYDITYDEYLSNLSDFDRYKREVRLLTNKVDITLLENYEKRGVAGTEGAYHLDHKIEVSEGYVNGIPPHEIAKIENLHFIPWELNMKKRKFPNGIHNPNIKKYYGKSKS